MLSQTLTGKYIHKLSLRPLNKESYGTLLPIFHRNFHQTHTSVPLQDLGPKNLRKIAHITFHFPTQHQCLNLRNVVTKWRFFQVQSPNIYWALLWKMLSQLQSHWWPVHCYQEPYNPVENKRCLHIKKNFKRVDELGSGIRPNWVKT